VEMYLFNEALVRKFLTIVTMGCTCPVSSVLEELGKVLQRLFVMRLANQELGWNMAWLSCERTCKRKGNTIVFDEGNQLIHSASLDRCHGPRLPSDLQVARRCFYVASVTRSSGLP